VKKPAMMAFHGSSFFRTPLTAQSNVLNMPPQTPKLPPSTGARALIAVRAVKESATTPSRFGACVVNSYLLSVVHRMGYCGNL
jgi:hypothetical protein